MRVDARVDAMLDREMELLDALARRPEDPTQLSSAAALYAAEAGDAGEAGSRTVNRAGRPSPRHDGGERASLVRYREAR